MDHKPWVGPDYRTGINGKTIMIVGNSHWLGDGDIDHEDASVDTIRKVVNGDYKDIAFFNQIRDYFGFNSHDSFWPRIIFMNYAPWSIGNGDGRFNHLTMEMAKAGKERFKREVSYHRPDLVFIFSKKIQWALPELTYESAALPLPDAQVGVLPEVPATKIYLLRHTQGACKTVMTETVKAVLGLK